MTEIAAEKNSTMIIPLPIELLKYFQLSNEKLNAELNNENTSKS